MSDIIDQTVQIVCATYNDSVPDIAEYITKVYAALLSLGSALPSASVIEKQEPAVPIKKSIHPDYIVCLEDGIKLKMLKRHLAKLGMTPAEYREKWGLPDDYPMVAPAYAKRRSDLAKSIGLGQKKAA